MYDFQKANIWKRFSAWLFDFILIGILIVGVAFLLSLILQYTPKIEDLTEQEQIKEQAAKDVMIKYEEKYGIHLDMPNYDSERYEKMTEEEKQQYLEAAENEKKDDLYLDKIEADSELTALYNKFAVAYERYMSIEKLVSSLALVITTFSVLIGFLIAEFVVPLIFKNGQTLGKKIFSIGVMRVDGVRVTPLQMFLRSILGKATLETLVPIYMILMIVFNVGLSPIICLAIMAALLLSEIVLLVATVKKERTLIHDIMSGTVTVDFASQMIFESQEELLAYKQSIHKDTVNSQREENPTA